MNLTLLLASTGHYSMEPREPLRTPFIQLISIHTPASPGIHAIHIIKTNM